MRKIAFISDIHEDIYSLTQALKILNSCKTDQIFCLGDVIGHSRPRFGPYQETRSARACCQLLIENNITTLAGNHDLAVLKKLPDDYVELDMPSDFYDLSHDEQKSIGFWWYHDDNTDMSAETTEWMKSRPSELISRRIEHKLYLSHYFSSDLAGMSMNAYKSRDLVSPHLEHVKANHCKFAFMGHEHPNGFRILRSNEDSLIPFGRKVKLDPDNPCLIIAPAIAYEEKRQSGVLLFDTDTFEIEALSL